MKKLDVKVFILGPIETNCYICYSRESRDAVLIDPADASLEVLNFIAKNNLKLKLIVFTHGHWDHITGADYFKDKLKTQIACHQNELQLIINSSLSLSPFLGTGVRISEISKTLEEGEEIMLGDDALVVKTTPGHSPGSIILLSESNGFLFSGDTIFCQGIGRTDLPQGSETELVNSIEKCILTLNDNLRFYPGHGQSDTIGNFRKWYNKYWV